MTKRSNKSRLFVPEPPFRPGDKPDYSHITVPANHTPHRPDPMVEAHETSDHALRLIRVMRFNGEVEGEWDPKLDPDVLRAGLRFMTINR